MKYLDLTYPSPAENLAADEVLLELAETTGAETLRIWESPEPFVVLGYSNRVRQEVNVAACEQMGLKILRRISGGGTVVQGPGCLSYAVTLQIAGSGPLSSITGTNRFVMETHRRALETLIKQPVRVRGHTDLETGGRKFSGNAQRRRRHALLFHGTILYAAELDLFGTALLHPSREPKWRGRRPHGEFIANVRPERNEIIAALRSAWNADVPASSTELSATDVKLLTHKHSDPAWIHRLP